MSEENVEIVRRAYEAWNEGGAEAAKQFWAEDIEFHDPLTFPTRGWSLVGMPSPPI
jgi:ketosteroid isomerase-like protein